MAGLSWSPGSWHTRGLESELRPLPDDRYIPVRVENLVAEVAASDGPLAGVATDIDALELAFEHVVSLETAAFRRELARRYEVFNPARETIAHGEDPSVVATDKRIDELRSMARYLLDKANFEPLDEGQLEATLRLASTHGMSIRVNPDRIHFIDLYVRGRSTATRNVRTLRHPFAGEERTIEIFRRLAVVFRPCDSDLLNLKLFREIPLEDVEALLPHAEPQMTRFDKLKIIGGALGALGGVATKLWAVLVHGAVVASGLLWAGIIAAVGLSVRSFFGYRNAKTERASQMTHHLYYQNVANNAGVLDQLLSSIAREELKEALVGYAILRAHPGLGSADAFAEAARTWLQDAFGVSVDFDGADALESVTRLELWEDRDAWTVLEPEVVVEQLDARWRARRGRDYHLRAWRKAAAESTTPSTP